jgi:cytochrome oxidase Cu insertion factor (SCO1/SenC/PrrC family)
MRLTILFCAFVFTGCGVATDNGKNTEPVHPDLDYPVGTFSLTERSGQTITDRDLRGHVWIASFIFTRCNGPCPQVTSTMARLQAELKDSPDVRFVTFTVDPKRDDLSALREYANNRKADPKRWLFLTGDETTIHTLMREQFKQPVERKTDPGVEPGDEFGHSSRLVLVDRKNVVRAMCDGLPDERFPERFEQDFAFFQKRIRELLQEK